MSDPKPPMPPSRALVLSVMMSLLVSSFVYAGLSYRVLVPQIARQELEIRALRAELDGIKSEMDEEEEEDAAPAPAPTPTPSAYVAPVAPGAAAPTPAPTPAPSAAAKPAAAPAAPKK